MTEAEKAEEDRRGRVAGPAAIAAAILFPAGLVWGIAVNNDRPDGDAAELGFADEHAAELVTAAALRSVALLLLAVVTVHLYRATLARKPDLNRVVVVTGLFGTIAFALGNLAYELFFAIAGADFSGREFASAAAANKEAKDLFDSPARIIAGSVTSAGSLALAFWFVIGSLNAMRVGLLTRFMGVLGIIIGPGLLILPPIPFVMTFWLIALGLLFLGRWPRALPPAWETGEAIPWPKPGEPETATTTAPEPAASQNGEVNPVGPGVRKPEPEAGQPAGGQPRRKRKRRR
jgi:uncharacterized protein DUF4386